MENKEDSQKLKVIIFDRSRFDVLGFASDAGKLAMRFFFGFIDSLRIDYVFRLWRQDPSLQPILVRCVALNIFYCLVMIALEWFFALVFSGYSSTDLEAPSANSWPLLETVCWSILFGIYHIIWVVPMFAATFLRSNMWYSDLAKLVPPPIAPRHLDKGSASETTFISQLSDSLSFALQLMILKVFTSAFAAIPYTGWYLSAVLQCLLASYYAFESHWMRSHPGQSSIFFISFIERDYSYFLGFGVLLTALTIYLPVFMSLAVYAAILPIFIIVAARPEAAAWQRSSTKPTFKVFPTAIKYFDIGHKLADLITI